MSSFGKNYDIFNTMHLLTIPVFKMLQQSFKQILTACQTVKNIFDWIEEVWIPESVKEINFKVKLVEKWNAFRITNQLVIISPKFHLTLAPQIYNSHIGS